MSPLLHPGHLGPAVQATGAVHAADHGPALVALTVLPVAIMAALTALEVGACADFPAAARLRAAYLAAPPVSRLAALGLAISATVHLALALTAPHGGVLIAVFFALDAVALLAVAGWATVLPVAGWRTAGAALLSAGLIAYVMAVGAGLEEFDLVGVATKLVELATLGLLIAAARRPAQRGGLYR